MISSILPTSASLNRNHFRLFTFIFHRQQNLKDGLTASVCTVEQCNYETILPQMLNITCFNN